MALRWFRRRRAERRFVGLVRAVSEQAVGERMALDEDVWKENLFNIEFELTALRRSIRTMQKDHGGVPEYMLEREAELVEDMSQYKAGARLCQHLHCRERSAAGHTYVWNWGWCDAHL